MEQGFEHPLRNHSSLSEGLSRMGPRLFLSLFLLLGLACGGSGAGGGESPSPLNYQDPAPEGWRLVKDSTSTSNRLVLAMVGPEGTRIRGVALTLLVDDSLANFALFDQGSYLDNPGVLVTTETDTPGEASLLQLQPALRLGNKLSVGLFQKDIAEAPKEAHRPLLRIALRAVPGAAAGSTVALIQRKACILPADLAASQNQPVPIQVKMGKLIVN